jgi:hypothetical protein
LMASTPTKHGGRIFALAAPLNVRVDAT